MDQGKKRITQTNQVQERNDQSNIEYGRSERFIIDPRTQVPDEFCGGNGDGRDAEDMMAKVIKKIMRTYVRLQKKACRTSKSIFISIAPV